MEGFLKEGLRKLLGRNTYQPLNTIEISRKNLISNYKYLKKLNPKIKIAPVLKSNAYGHGLVEIAKILEGCGACHVPFFCVDSIYEAYELLKTGIKTPILIMGYINPENLTVKSLPFSYAVCDLKLLQVINKHQPEAGVHLFVDTGMNREGIPINQLPIYLLHLQKLPNIKIEGLMSHLASAEAKDAVQSLKQIKNFEKAKVILRKYNLEPIWFHLFASKGFLQKRYNKKDGLANMARVGMAIFGIDPLGKDQNLKPVLELKTKIAQIKKVRKGEFIGYGATFRAKQNLTAGILPIGYFDGVDRRLSNKGFVTINALACPIIGLVSMNITTIDLSAVTNPTIGQEVIIYSNNPNDPNSIQNVAKICKAIPYEILTHLTPFTRREVV